MVFSQGIPAMAAKSMPTQGEASLNDIREESEDITEMSPGTIDESKADGDMGLNLVQGDADKNKMKRPGNSNATSVEEKIDEALKDTFKR
ncbi:MAG: low temperature-induced protein [Cyanobacteria bacterium J06592_8]